MLNNEMYCPNINCRSDGWEVDQMGHEEWSVGCDTWGHWTVVAAKPVCPACGADLRRESNGSEQLHPPIFEYLSSL